MGAYENALVEEGTRDELVRHFLLARQELAEAEARVAELEKMIDRPWRASDTKKPTFDETEAR